MIEPHPIANDYLMDLIVEKLSSKVIFYKNGKPKKKPGLTRDEIYGCFEQFRKVEESTYNSAKESSNSKATPSHAQTSDDVLRSDKVLDELVKQCETVPLTSRSNEYDHGFCQAMSLVRQWISQFRQQTKGAPNEVSTM
jgi:hypothetical protein